MSRKRTKAEYLYEATSVVGLIQQLNCYMRCGYWFYVVGQIREGRDTKPIDEGILERYDIAVSKYTRHRDKECGLAGVQYLRFERTYLILATHGKHKFFEKEVNIRDARRVPIKFAGYSVTHEGGARVRIERERAKELRAYFVDVATKRRASDLRAEFWNVPFEPYGPVRKQLFGILKEVNELRKATGMERVPASAVRKYRRLVKPFEPVDGPKERPRGKVPAFVEAEPSNTLIAVGA